MITEKEKEIERLNREIGRLEALLEVSKKMNAQQEGAEFLKSLSYVDGERIERKATEKTAGNRNCGANRDNFLRTDTVTKGTQRN